MRERVGGVGEKEGGRREEKGGRNMDVRDRLTSCLSHRSWWVPGTELATQVHVLDLESKSPPFR